MRYVSIDGATLGCPLKWTCLRDLGAAKGLTHLELDFVQDGPLNVIHNNQLAAFKDLRTLILNWEPAPVANAANSANTARPETAPLPPGICNLKNLEVLKLSSSTIGGRIPNEISNLSSLKELSVTNGKLAELPVEFSILPALTKLSFAHNTGSMMLQKNTWRILADLENLQHLDLTDSNVRTVQDVLHVHEGLDNLNFLSLEHLDLSCNRLGPIPEIDDLMTIICLETLNLSNCSLSVVPPKLSQAYALETLDLSCNQLVDLPEDMSELGCLMELRAADNAFPALPAVIKSMERLVVADFSRCCYLEIASSMKDLVESLDHLRNLKLHKLDKGMFQQSSKMWLAELSQEFENAGRGPVLRDIDGILY